MKKTREFEVTDNTIDRIGNFVLDSALELTEASIDAGTSHEHIKIIVTVVVE